ncbi:MAG TPA: aspartate kinase [Pyrinomonadaceae bacterium]|jgi:aspartate kinase
MPVVYSFSTKGKLLPSNITVMKFGGTSVKDAKAFDRVGQIIHERNHAGLVIVVSAMSGVTDALIASVRIAARAGAAPAIQTLEEHLERHLQVARGLGVRSRRKIERLVADSRRDIIGELNKAHRSRSTGSREVLDSVTSHGEQLSANLLVVILKERDLAASYVDARRCILTDHKHGNAQPLFPQTFHRMQAELHPILQKKRIPVMGGFIGASRNGATTTMGRGSSDFTATIISAALGARETQIWTDVDGILSADPHLVPTAITVPQLSFAEALELSRFGARVLYSRTIHPAMGQKIPISVRNSLAPSKVGTLICEAPKQAGIVKILAHKPNVTTIEVRPFANPANGFMTTIRRALNRHHLSFEVLSLSSDRVSFSCSDGGLPESLIRDLEQLGSVGIERERSILACIGTGLDVPERLDHYRARFRVLTPELIWQSTSNLNLIATVAPGLASVTLKRLHSALF